ncbi:hypothetical protein WJX74_001872 [Apatococcus lobatus]|uniref:UmuC domain-containing protein n=1 Tax=Apatococcus lobatus TaxID=904363 RepID=A0AAW1QZW5_9CHLO
MQDKKALEAYRVRQFGQSLFKDMRDPTSSTQAEEIVPDTARVVAHFDVDAFYCQVEELRRPGLSHRPMGVTQKYLIVTCNYPARAAGVRKLMSIKEAQQICPDLVLVSGEDLTPYRQASKSILNLLRRFGVAERLGMDEVMVDITAEVEQRMLQGMAQRPVWHGHVYSAQMALVQDNKHRPMDLRVNKQASTAVVEGCMDAACIPLSTAGGSAEVSAWQVRLQIGSAIAREARAVVKAEAGFRCAAGIACNKMLAKLVGGLHKPDDQTTLPPSEAAAFVASLPVRALPGVGYKLNTELEQRGVMTAEELRRWSIADLAAAFGDRYATFLLQACRGQDPSPVQDKGPPKSITVEDSFKSCTSLPAARHILRILTPDLLTRIQEDWQETGRMAHTLTLKFRLAKQGWHRSSSSCPVPGIVNPQQAVDDPQVEAVVNAAMLLLSKHIQPPFQLTLLNIGVTNFQVASGQAQLPSAFSSLLGKRKTSDPLAGGPSAAASGAGHRSAKQATDQRRDYGAAPKGPPMSKSAERAMAEREILPFPGQASQSPTLPLGSAPMQQHAVHQQPVQRAAGSHAPQVSKKVHGMAQRQPSQPCAAVDAGPQASGIMFPAGQAAMTNFKSQFGNQQGAQGEEVPNDGVSHPAHGGWLVSSEPMQTAPARGSAAMPRRFTNAAPKHRLLGMAAGTYGDRDMAGVADEKEELGDEDELWDDLRGLESGPSAVRFSRKPPSQPPAPATPWVMPQAATAPKYQPAAPSADAAQIPDSVLTRVNSLPASRSHAAAEAAAGEAMSRSLTPPAAAESAVPPSNKAALSAAAVPSGQATSSTQSEHRAAVPGSERSAPQMVSEAGPEVISLQAQGSHIREGPGSTAPASHGSCNQRVIIHCDVDCFYCQVERLDDASLKGVPLAVQQFNSGGFVAVSYEARAEGIRCGDGVGDAGRASIQRLKDMGAVSLAEAKRKCPALQIRPMRTDRYRQVAAMVHSILQAHAPGCPVEKASYDDFYLDVTAMCHMDMGPADSPPPQLHIIHQGQWPDVAADMRHALLIAVDMRKALVKQLGMTISVGVARNKLLARLVGPMRKPDGLSVLPDCATQPFLCSQPLQSIPSLRQKLGGQVVQALGVTSVGQLAGFLPEDLIGRFGPTTGAFLAALPLARDETPVRDRGPQKSIMAERSCPPLESVAAIEAALQPLAASLLQRLAQDARQNSRMPTKLSLTCREGYGAPRTRSMPIPAAALAALQRFMASDSPAAAASWSSEEPDAEDQQTDAQPKPKPEASNPQLDSNLARTMQPFLHGAITLLHSFIKPPYNLTRLALGCAFDSARDTDLSGLGPRKITSFFAQPKHPRPSPPASKVSSGDACMEGAPSASSSDQGHPSSLASPPFPTIALMTLEKRPTNCEVLPQCMRTNAAQQCLREAPASSAGQLQDRGDCQPRPEPKAESNGLQNPKECGSSEAGKHHAAGQRSGVNTLVPTPHQHPPDLGVATANPAPLRQHGGQAPPSIPRLSDAPCNPEQASIREAAPYFSRAKPAIEPSEPSSGPARPAAQLGGSQKSPSHSPAQLVVNADVHSKGPAEGQQARTGITEIHAGPLPTSSAADDDAENVLIADGQHVMANCCHHQASADASRADTSPALCPFGSSVAVHTASAQPQITSAFLAGDILDSAKKSTMPSQNLVRRAAPAPALTTHQADTSQASVQPGDPTGPAPISALAGARALAGAPQALAQTQTASVVHEEPSPISKGGQAPNHILGRNAANAEPFLQCAPREALQGRTAAAVAISRPPAQTSGGSGANSELASRHASAKALEEVPAAGRTRPRAPAHAAGGSGVNAEPASCHAAAEASEGGIAASGTGPRAPARASGGSGVDAELLRLQSLFSGSGGGRPGSALMGGSSQEARDLALAARLQQEECLRVGPRNSGLIPQAAARSRQSAHRSRSTQGRLDSLFAARPAPKRSRP